MTLPRLMLAPTGARLTKKDHPGLPMTIPEIVATAVACHEAGAAGLHAHIRDSNGEHTLDAGLYGELLAELARAAPGLYVQITSDAAGRFTPAAQRALVETLRPAAVSIALREIAAEEDASVTARFFAFCTEARIDVQHILYDAADMSRLAHLVANGTIPRENLAVLHVLGRYTTGQVSDLADLDPPLSVQFASGLAPDWAVCAFGAAEFDCLLAALKAGGKARVGFENNRQNRDGTVAASNAERVRDLIAAARDAGLPLLPPSQAPAGHGVAQPVAQIGDRPAMGQECRDSHHFPALAFLSEDDPPDLLGTDMAGEEDRTAARNMVRIELTPPDQPLRRQDQSEFLAKLPQRAVHCGFVALAPAAGKVPVARKRQVRSVVSQIGQHPPPFDQRDLRADEGGLSCH